MTLRERIERQIELLRYDKQWTFVEWSVFRPTLESTLLNLLQPIIEEKEKVINELQQENRRLQGQLNMKLGKDPERDHQIVALHRKGLSKAKIARAVGMSKWGVSLALKRLNGQVA